MAYSNLRYGERFFLLLLLYERAVRLGQMEEIFFPRSRLIIGVSHSRLPDGNLRSSSPATTPTFFFCTLAEVLHLLRQGTSSKHICVRDSGES